MSRKAGVSTVTAGVFLFICPAKSSLIQMASSPASNILLIIKAFVHDSKSNASPFCEYQGLKTFTLLIVICSHDNGCRHQLGEFLNVTFSSNTFLHFTMFSNTGRNHGRISFQSSSVSIPTGLLKSLHASAPFKAPAVGYQISPS